MFPFRVLSLASSLKTKETRGLATRCESTKAQWRVINREVTANDEQKLPIVSQIRFAMKENRRVERRTFQTRFPDLTPDTGHFHFNTPRYSGKHIVQICRMNRGVMYSRTKKIPKYTRIVLYEVFLMKYRYSLSKNIHLLPLTKI